MLILDISKVRSQQVQQVHVMQKKINHSIQVLRHRLAFAPLNHLAAADICTRQPVTQVRSSSLLRCMAVSSLLRCISSAPPLSMHASLTDTHSLGFQPGPQSPASPHLEFVILRL